MLYKTKIILHINCSYFLFVYVDLLCDIFFIYCRSVLFLRLAIDMFYIDTIFGALHISKAPDYLKCIINLLICIVKRAQQQSVRLISGKSWVQTAGDHILTTKTYNYCILLTEISRYIHLPVDLVYLCCINKVHSEPITLEKNALYQTIFEK